MQYRVLADSIVTTKGRTEVKGAIVDEMYFPKDNIKELVASGFIELVKEEAKAELPDVKTKKTS